MVKIFTYDTEKDKVRDNKCGCCNWDYRTLYVIADSQQEADKYLAETIKDGGNALCGQCMIEVLQEGEYQIFRRDTIIPQWYEKEELEEVLGEKITYEQFLFLKSYTEKSNLDNEINEGMREIYHQFPTH